MSRDYDEKRDYVRVNVEGELQFRLQGEDEERVGLLKNLSGRGMMFIADQPIPVESMLDVKLVPVNPITPPLEAEVRVVRMCKQRHGNGYEIGAVIQQDEEEESSLSAAAE